MDARQHAWALEQAEIIGLSLTEFDWQVLEFCQVFYVEHGVMPLTRRVIKFIKENLEPDFDSLKLQIRYTEKPLTVIAKLAGLPKPVQCI